MSHDMTLQKPEAPRLTPAEWALKPFRDFAHVEASGGIVLMASAVIALAWANSPWAASYDALWQTRVTLGFGGLLLDKPLILWINDGLMAVFFFVVGLEIKREVLAGELSSPAKAALPIAAAVGGMLAPAGIYLLFARDPSAAAGWGIPMATDIAFALGVLALLGDRVPVSLKIFLTALAIVDDLGAVLVIALFYTAEIAWSSLAAGVAGLVLLFVANAIGVRRPLVYAAVGFFVWIAFLKSGVHATIAGVLLAGTIPARARIAADEFVDAGREMIDGFETAGAGQETTYANAEQQAYLHELESAAERVQTPLHRLEHALHPWVMFAIMPIFALANAGVSVGGSVGAAVTNPVFLGIVAGLIVGKQVGVTLFAWLAVRTGLASLPADVSWRQIYGAGWLAGIGFTMSLFIAGLAFDDEALLSVAKLGILTASVIAGVVGWLLLRSTGRPT